MSAYLCHLFLSLNHAFKPNRCEPDLFTCFNYPLCGPGDRIGPL